ncbi:MAG: hypothetical protein KF859_14010 [Phycisphaeraceae bacterium]|nr:hypothetical protein [Phycisphaeraceae bacterium]
MKMNSRKGGVCGTAAVLAAMSGLAVCGTAHGQLTVSNNFTQNGGTLAIPNGPNKLTIGGAGNPTLTLTNGANGNAASALFIGRQAGHSGTLVLEQSSQMVLNPNGPPSTYASIGEVTAGAGTVRVRTNALLNSTSTLIVGELGVGSVIVEQGGRVRTPFLSVASEGAGQGTVLVTGQNSRLDCESPNFPAGFELGSFGQSGTMIVSNGGVVTAPGNGFVGWGTSGALTVFDPGSSVVLGGQFNVGASSRGQGTVNVSHGAMLVSGSSKIGAVASSGPPATTGAVTVTGTGSLWSNNGELLIGTAGAFGPAEFPSSGTLTVSNNAQMINAEAMIVGRTSQGQLNITGGGTVSATATDANFPYAVVLGFSNTSDGRATVSGTGSALNLQGGLIVGNSGYASLTISNGGLVTNGDASMGFFQASECFATVEGQNSRWLSGGNVYVGGNFSQQDNHLFGGQANLLVRDGGLVRSQGVAGVTIFQNSTLYGAGGVIMGNTVENRGLVVVGQPNERGMMTIAGNYRQTATGELNVTLAGLAEGTGYDRLVVTNQAFLAGELSVYVHPDFALGYNQVFDILTSNSVLSGQFHELENGALVGTYNGVDLFIRYAEVEGPAGNGGVVRLYTNSCSRCPADYNQDGGIDGADVQAFFADWEQGLPCSDVNEDGGIDGSDVQFFFGVWENGGC